MSTVVDFTRRGVLLGAGSLAAVGAGVTTAASGLEGSVEGQADVQAEQALTVTSVNVAGDQDASFTRVSDDNTQFQAAVELNNGDAVAFRTNIENSALDGLDIQIAVDSPDPIDIEVQTSETLAGDIDPDNDGGSDEAIQTGEGIFVASVPGGSGGEANRFVSILAELDDTADPGSYDIGVAINPLSTDN